MRALELLDVGAEPPSAGEGSQLWAGAARHPTLLVGLTMEPQALYARIEERVERMLAAGAREEVLRAVSAGASRTARKAVGFEELLAGDVDAMKRRSRNYAKRQLTWMRKLPNLTVVDMTEGTAYDGAQAVAGVLATIGSCERDQSGGFGRRVDPAC